MFTAVAQKDLAVAEKYFDEHLEQNDSVPAVTLGDRRLVTANAEAARLAFRELETDAAAGTYEKTGLR